MPSSSRLSKELLRRIGRCTGASKFNGSIAAFILSKHSSITKNDEDEPSVGDDADEGDSDAIRRGVFNPSNRCDPGILSAFGSIRSAPALHLLPGGENGARGHDGGESDFSSEALKRTLLTDEDVDESSLLSLFRKDEGFK